MKNVLAISLFIGCSAYGMEKSLTEPQTKHMHQVIRELEWQGGKVTGEAQIKIKDCYLGVVNHRRMKNDIAVATGFSREFVSGALTGTYHALNLSTADILAVFNNRN